MQTKWMPEDRCLFHKVLYIKQDTNIKKKQNYIFCW